MTNTKKMIASIADFCFMLERHGKYSKEETIGFFGDATVSELYDAICSRAEPVYSYSTDGDLAMYVMYEAQSCSPTMPRCCGDSLLSVSILQSWQQTAINHFPAILRCEYDVILALITAVSCIFYLVLHRKKPPCYYLCDAVIKPSLA